MIHSRSNIYKMNKNILGYIIVFIAAAGLMFMFNYYVGGEDQSCTQLKQVLYYESLEMEFADMSTDIYDYYGLASEAYDYNYWEDVIYYCEKSRDVSQEYSQKLRIVKAEYPEELPEILEVRKEMIENAIETLFALYQSCEYLESAARAYGNYDYDTGDVNIEGQNEQIVIHDHKLEEYYNLDAKYQKLKRELVA